MKNVAIWTICSLSTFVAVALLATGGLWSLAGLAWSLMLYVSGHIFPKVWRSYWITNMKILRVFGIS